MRILFLLTILLYSTSLAQDTSKPYTNYESLLDTAYIVGHLNVYLGLISADTTNPQSIMNLHSEYGNDDAYHCIFGEGPYGRLHGEFSPFNWTCQAPPKVFIDTMFVAYLTENENIAPRISTYGLVGFLYDRVGITGSIQHAK